MKTKFFIVVLALTVFAIVDCFCENNSNNYIASQNVQPVYGVGNYKLLNEIGDFQIPDFGPAYEGGTDALEEYFSANSLKGTAEEYVFKVHIYFLVDENGLAKDFDLLVKVEPRNQEKRQLLGWGNEVVDIASRMPQKWTPAKVDGRPVACYKTLSFMVISGKVSPAF